MLSKKLEIARKRMLVPVAMAWRWAAESPDLPYRELSGLDRRYHRHFLEMSDGNGAVYVFALRARYHDLAHRFWKRVDEWLAGKEDSVYRAFIRAFYDMEGELEDLAVYREGA